MFSLRGPQLLSSFVVVLVVSAPLVSSGQERQRVLFAGHMFVTDAGDVPELFPRLSAVLDAPPWSEAPLGQVLAKAYHGLQTSTFAIDAEGLATNVAEARIVMGLAFDSEMLTVESFAMGHKVLGELSAQALVFDFGAKTVLAAFPLVVQRIELLPRPPTVVEERALIGRLLSAPGEASVLTAFEDALRGTTLKVNPRYRLGVRSVTFAESTRPLMPGALRSAGGRVERAMANRFAQFMATHQGVSMVPYSGGQAVGGQMALRYANGETVNLTWPAPDYVFDLEVSSLRKVELRKGAGATVYAYGVFARVRLLEALSGRTYLDIPIKHAVTKTVPVTQHTVDDWATFQEALLDFGDEFTRRLGRPEMSQWLKPRMASGVAVPDLAPVIQLMEKVR